MPGKLLLIAASCLITGSFGWAVPVIDQNQPNAETFLASFEQPDLAQSFQQANNNIAGAGVFFQPLTGTSGSVTISLWDALPNAGGNLLRTASTVGTQGTWADVFWTPIAITPNTTYFLVFAGDPPQGIAGAVNPYSRGQAYANAGFQPVPLFDYTFRTYYDNSLPGVPEGGDAVFLLAISLATVWTLARRVTITPRAR